MLGDMVNALKLPKCQHIALEIEESNQSYLLFLTTKDDTALKDNHIQQLEIEMNEQNKKLQEQSTMLKSFVEEEKKKSSEMEEEMKQLQLAKKEEERQAREADEEFEKQKKAIEELKQNSCCSIA